MKWIIALLAVALLAGCASDGNWGVMNNTRYTLQVVQDGAPVARVEPGETVVLKKRVWVRYSSVCVSAYQQNLYMGGNSYTFYWERAYMWQVDNVNRPGDVR
jgi:uncharacterized protein YcfL